VAFLAADELEGRKPGSSGNQSALDLVEARFSELGLEPAAASSTFRQAFSYEEWSNRDASLTVDGSGYNQWSDYAVFQYSGGGQVDAEVVFAGYGLTVPPFDADSYPLCPLDPATGYDDFADVDVTDKVALVMRHGPADDQAIYLYCPVNDACFGGPTECAWLFGYKAANARQHGAAALLLVQHYAETAYIMENATVGPEYYDGDFPALFLNRDKVEYALPGLPGWATAIDDDLAPASVETGISAVLDVDVGLETIATENLLGAVPGSDPSLSGEVILVSSNVDGMGVHLKTGIIYNGADANASGTAVMLDLARHATAIDPARTVLFAAWNARDAGLLGSAYYTTHTTAYGLGDIEAVINLDLVGAGDGTGVDLVGGAAPENAWLFDLMVGAAADEELSYEVLASPPLEEPAADDATFGAAGIPAVQVSTIGGHYLHHTPDDTIATISSDDLEAAACVTRAALTHLAQGTEDQYLSSAPPPQSVVEPDAYWVFLHDKGVPADEVEQALSAREAELAPEAMERRQRVRGDRGLDERDLAVHEPYVDQLAAVGAVVRSRSRWLNAVGVVASVEQRAAIGELGFVERLQPVARRLPRLEPDPSWDPHPLSDGIEYGLATDQLEMIGARALHGCGYTGAGVIVAVQDGGFNVQHEVFEGLDVVDEHDFINDDDFTMNQSGDPPGQHNHGTSVLSLVAGWNEGTFCGVAPGVSVILSKTEDVSQEVPSEEDLWVEGLEWIEGLGAHIMTTSLGYSLWYDGLEDVDGQTAVTTVAAAAAVENGLIMLNSAGNGGPDPITISAPADAEGVIAVGALQFDGHIAGFSSRGPTYDGRTKPDVSAPGVDVWVADPNNLGGYMRSSGTSFAAPLTAGLVALLLEAYPDYGPAEMYDLLTSTASMADLPNNQYGWGQISGEAAAPLACTCVDADQDGYYDIECGGLDCDDTDPAVHPEGTEVLNDGIDQDCDGVDTVETGADFFAAAGGACGAVAVRTSGFTLFELLLALFGI
jgi:hypothetical protein